MIKVENGVVTDPNYSVEKLRKEFNTSLKRNYTEADLAEFGVYIPATVPQPAPSARSKTVVRTGYANISGTWTETWGEVDAYSTLEEYKQVMRIRITDKADQLRAGGLNVTGFVYETSRDPFALPAKASPKAQRKLIGRNGAKKILTSTEVEDVYDAIDDFIELVWDRQYDLIDLVDDAQSIAELDALDIDSGWPPNGL